MTIMKKLGALTSASALVAAGLVAVATTTASAQPVVADWDQEYYTVGATATLTVSGCAAGGTLEIAVPGEDENRVIEVTDPAAPTVIEVVLPGDVAGALRAAAGCTEQVEGGEPTYTETEAEAHILDQFITAVPAEFSAGDTIEVTVGEFIPGTAVNLVASDASGASVYTQALGAAGDDLKVVADVTFPETLPCGVYTVTITGGDNAVDSELTICDTSSPSPSPSPTATATATATATPTAAPTTTRAPGRPGLPSTGN